jgi:hypothetical protein
MPIPCHAEGRHGGSDAAQDALGTVVIYSQVVHTFSNVNLLFLDLRRRV